MDMEIDIISYTANQFAELTTEQILEVRSAQTKKNILSEKLAATLEKERARLIGNGMMHSDVWTLIQEKLTATYEAEVERIRERLLFYLHYSKEENDETGDNPYPVDYSLSWKERYYSVKDYYEATYTNAEERFNLFKADTVARKYLGEFYASLYDYFKMLMLQAEQEAAGTEA